MIQFLIMYNKMQSYVLSDTEMLAGTLKCDCPLACDVVSYETTTTTAAFPNPSLIKILQTRGYNRTDDYLRYVKCS